VLCQLALLPRVSQLLFSGTNFPLISKINNLFTQVLLWDVKMVSLSRMWVIKKSLVVRCRCKIHHNELNIWVKRLTVNINKSGINGNKEMVFECKSRRNPEDLPCLKEGLWLAFMSWLGYVWLGQTLSRTNSFQSWCSPLYL
jgi:hypothetical protein